MEKDKIRLSVDENVSIDDGNDYFNDELFCALTGEDDTYILLWNDDDNIEYISPSFQHLFKANMNDLIGVKWMDIIPEQYKTEIMNHFVSSEDKLMFHRLHCKCESGRQYVFKGSLQQINLNNKNYFLMNIQNITQSYILEKSIFNSHKFLMINQLGAGIVHEIKNPLASIKGFLQLIKKGINQKDEYYDLMIREIERIDSMANQLLSNGKRDNQFRFLKENVYSMVKNICYLFSLQDKYRDIEIKIDIDHHLYIKCNRSHIKQVLLNVIKNGIEAMNNRGTLQIQSSLEDGYVIISIKDEGQGIDKSVLDRIKYPTFTTKEDGTGLGLMISNRIINQHNGKIRVSSIPSIGTTFEILLPYS